MNPKGKPTGLECFWWKARVEAERDERARKEAQAKRESSPAPPASGSGIHIGSLEVSGRAQ